VPFPLEDSTNLHSITYINNFKQHRCRGVLLRERVEYVGVLTLCTPPGSLFIKEQGKETADKSEPGACFSTFAVL